MTIEQQKLVEDNLKLVPWVIWKWRFCRDPKYYEDAVSDGYVALCQAAELYDQSKGTFATYATKAIRRWLANKIRERNTQSRAHYKTMYSLNHKIGHRRGHGRKATDTYLDVLVDETATYDYVEQSDVVRSIAEIAERVMAGKCDNAKIAYRMYIDGKSYNEMAVATGVSRSRCQQYVKEINVAVRMAYAKKEV